MRACSIACILVQVNHVRYSQKKDRQDYNKKRGFEAVDVDGPTDDIVPSFCLSYLILSYLWEGGRIHITFEREGSVPMIMRGIKGGWQAMGGNGLGGSSRSGVEEGRGCVCSCSIVCLHCLQVQPKKKRCNLLDSDPVFVPPNYNRDQ